MKIKDIKELGLVELKQKNRDLQEELFRLRIRHTTGQLDSTATLGKVKKDIARIKTVLREKEAGGSQ
jgi:large subunit ribosomal protein L29